MKRLIPVEEDAYDYEAYQLSFYVQNGQLSFKKCNLDQEKQQLIYSKRFKKTLSQPILSYSKEKLQQLLNEYIELLSSENSYSIYNSPYSMKMDVINIIILILYRTFSFPELTDSFMTLSNLFFQNEKRLNYDSNIENDDVDQMKLGEIRHIYYYIQNQKIALELKKVSKCSL